MTWPETAWEKSFFESIWDWFKGIWEKIKNLSWKFTDRVKDIFNIESKTEKGLAELAKEIVENQTRKNLKELREDMEKTTWLTEKEMTFIWRNKDLFDYYKWLTDKFWNNIAKEKWIYFYMILLISKKWWKLTMKKRIKLKILTEDKRKNIKRWY